MAWLLIANFKFPEAIEMLLPAIEQATNIDETIVAQLKLELGRAYYFAGNIEAAAAPGEEALTIAERHGLLETIARGLIARSNVLFAKGRRREALAILGLAYDIGRENDLTDVTIRAGNNYASAHS